MSELKDDAYYKSLDKRTREYKDFKIAQQKIISEQSKGAGDVIEKVLDKTGIAAGIHLLFGEDCGCSGRRDKVNGWLPASNQAVKCIEEDDYFYLKAFFSRVRTRIDRTQQENIIRIFNYVFNKNEAPPAGCINCSNTGFVKNINRLKEYYIATQSIIDGEKE